MGRQFALLVCAVQFLTRLPTPALRDFQPDWLTRSARYFPLVGQVVGALSGLALLAASHLWSPWIAAILAVAAGVLVTGALHEDGLADTADGLFGGATPEARLAIMKDSRVGVFGVLVLLLALALKTASLASLPPLQAAFTLVAAHGLGRAAAALMMRLTRYASAGAPGKWAPAARGVSTLEAASALVLAAWPLILLPAASVAVGLLVAALLAAGLGLLAQRRLGGHTGDVLGAVEQMAEIGFLLGAAAVIR